MAFINEASVYWGKKQYQKTIELYEKAFPYLPDDKLISLFLGINYLFIGEEEKGKNLLKPLCDYTFDYAVSPETLASDYINGSVDAEGLKIIFLSVDETRESILEKQADLKRILEKFPQFRAGLLQFAVTYLQLNRFGEASQILQNYHEIDPSDPTISYYLSAIFLKRSDYQKAWSFLRQAESITKKKNHFPKVLKSLRLELCRQCPELAI